MEQIQFKIGPVGIAVCAVLAFASGFVVGCDEFDEAFDCQEICEEFRRCVDPIIDVNACQDRCFDAIDRDSVLQDEADECAACIRGRTCSEVEVDCDTCPDVYRTFRAP